MRAWIIDGAGVHCTVAIAPPVHGVELELQLELELNLNRNWSMHMGRQVDGGE